MTKAKGKAKQNKRKMMRTHNNAPITSNDDDRFMDLAKNPMFQEMPKKERKIKIDDRFKQMLTSKSFQERDFRVDKRGRQLRIKKTEEDYLERIYELEDAKKKGPETSTEKMEKDDKEYNDKIESSTDNEKDEESDEELKIHFDLARGQGNISSSSSDSEMEPEAQEEVQSEEDEVKELESGVRRVEWASGRLAICNLDWSKIGAEDLMLLLNSLKPTGGEIQSVTVYMSDFGAERIQKEKQHGPLLKLKQAKKGEDDDLDERTKQAIRAYEMDKLRYFYAVCVCDTTETATAIYETCDGVEYESSGLRFDIRFISDEMQFEDERIRERISAGQLALDSYKPKRVESHPLAISNPKLSWEETDSERRRTIKQAFNKEANLEEFESLIASGSEDEATDRTKYAALLSDEGRPDDSPDNEAKCIDKIDEVYEPQLTKHCRDAKYQTKPIEYGEDRELSDEEVSDEEAVDVKRPKKKTKLQLYLERKKQLKQERKLKEQEHRKLRKLNKEGEGKTTAETISEEVEKDSRFSAFFTDSAFAIDQTSSHCKGGGDLAVLQVKGKQKRQQTQKRSVHENEKNSTEQKAKRQKNGGMEGTHRELEKLQRKLARKSQ